MYSTENSHYHFKMVSVCNYMYVLSVYCFFYYSVCRHCVAVSPDSGVGGSFPTGGDIPHVPGPDSGKPPQGEGCFECDIKNQDIPLSKRAKREVHNQVSFRQNTQTTVYSVTENWIFHQIDLMTAKDVFDFIWKKTYLQ